MTFLLEAAISVQRVVLDSDHPPSARGVRVGVVWPLPPRGATVQRPVGIEAAVRCILNGGSMWYTQAIASAAMPSRTQPSM